MRWEVAAFITAFYVYIYVYYMFLYIITHPSDSSVLIIACMYITINRAYTISFKLYFFIYRKNFRQKRDKIIYSLCDTATIYAIE